MRYQQAYDPMQASAMRQQNNSQLAQSIKGGLSAIQEGLHQNAQYKAFVAKNKTATDAKANYYATVQSSLKEAGLDISKFPELANAPSDISNPDITVSQFMENVTKPLQSAKETILGKSAVAGQDAEIRQPMQQIKNIPGADTMAQIPPEQPQSSFVGPPAPAGAQSSFVGPQLPPPQNPDTMIGATEPLPDYAATDPSLTPEQMQHNNTVEAQRTMLKAFQDKSNAGMLVPRDAEKFTSDMMAMTTKDKELSLATIKKEIEDKKLESIKIKAAQAEGIANAHRAGFPVEKDGKKGISSDLWEDPTGYNVGETNPYKRTDWSSGGSGSNAPANIEFKLQKAVIDRLIASGKDKDFVKEGEDALGNPKYIPKPGTESYRILNNTDLYNAKVLEWFPKAAKDLGIVQPTTVPKGSGF